MTVAEIQDKIKSQGAQIQGLQFDYRQEMTSSLSPEVQKASGTAYIKKPKSLRIEQRDPEPQVIVGSGKNIFIYTPRFKQVLKDSWKRWVKKNPLLPGLFGESETFERLKKDFRWEVSGREDMNGEKTIHLRLRENPEPDGQELILWLGETDFIPRKTKMLSGTLEVTTTLVSLQVNPPLEDKLFRFVPPPGTVTVQMP